MSFLRKIKSFFGSTPSKAAPAKKGSYVYVNTQALLKDACRVIAASPWAAIDAEADSLHHYVEKLCLLQISVKGGDFVVDPLVPLDLKELARTLEPKFLLFHGADFDIRMVKKVAPFMPKQMFDTMLAAQILGYDRFGLADLAERICGVRLSKSSQKADWSRRPLTPELLDYAAGDTKYLERIYLHMKKDLQKLGRLEWHRQACDRLLNMLNEAPEEAKDETLRWQLRGSKELSGRALAYLRELWQWRESEAARLDRPSFKVLNTDYLLDMARWADQNPTKDIIEWTQAPRHLHRQYRDKINGVLRAAEAQPPAVFTAAEKSGKARRLRSSEEEKFNRLKDERLKLSQALKIQPSVLITNSMLEAVVRTMPKDLASMKAVEGLLPWQAEMIAPSFVKILDRK